MTFLSPIIEGELEFMETFSYRKVKQISYQNVSLIWFYQENEKESKHEQDMSQSYTTDQPTAPRGKDTEH